MSALNGILIGSALFARLTRVANTQTDRQTDRPCYLQHLYNRPHLCNACNAA